MSDTGSESQDRLAKDQGSRLNIVLRSFYKRLQADQVKDMAVCAQSISSFVCAFASCESIRRVPSWTFPNCLTHTSRMIYHHCFHIFR